MLSNLKNKLFIILFVSLVLLGCTFPLHYGVEAAAPIFKNNFTSHLTNEKEGWLLNPGNFGVNSDDKTTLRKNIVSLFYPRDDGNTSAIYKVLRGVTLGVMVIFFIIAGASLLLNKKPEENSKHLFSLLYIMLGGVFIYGANWLFGSVFHFSNDVFTQGQGGIGGFTRSLIGEGSVMFVILSAVKAFAFFLAIIMIVITGFKVMAAGEGEKGKKLIKGIINVVVALLIIKGVDFIYYLTADSSTFVENASDFIINVATVFAWIYGVIVFIMVLVAGYLYITDGGDGANFKKASNVFINVLLSALVLFGFLLITYQIFAEFQKDGDAVRVEKNDNQTSEDYTAYITIDQNYI